MIFSAISIAAAVVISPVFFVWPILHFTVQLPPTSSSSSQSGAFALNIHYPHETKHGGQCSVSGWPMPFCAHPAKIKKIIFQIARMKYNKLMFFENNLNSKEHTSQEGSLRVWKNWAHFLCLSLISHRQCRPHYRY